MLSQPDYNLSRAYWIDKIESNWTDEERKRAAEIRAERAAYEALPSKRKKELEELEIFRAFVRASGIEIDANSERNVEPPEPDICFTVNNSPYYFELSEIVDQSVARNHARMLKTNESVGGASSSFTPFEHILREKARKHYKTSNARIDLLIYYSRQHMIPLGEFYDMVLSNRNFLEVLLRCNNGPFDGVWMFSIHKNEVLLRI